MPTEQELSPQVADLKQFPSAIEIIGGIAAIVPFVVHISQSSTAADDE
jgi:hypothetical protein